MAPSAFEIDAFRFVNDLPDAFRIPFETVMQRGRPLDLVAHVAVRGPRITGYGYPSGHATVAAALVAVVVPYLPRSARRTGWVLVGLVAIALGAAIGALVNLVLGTPTRQLDESVVRRALASGHYPVGPLTRVGKHGNDATPYLATADDGAPVFVKAIDRDRRDADARAAVGRYLAFRHLEDETPRATAKQRVEHEALLAGLAATAGAHAARPITIASGQSGASVLVFEKIDGRALDEDGETALDDATVAALWNELAHLRAARIAHRHLGLTNVMLDAGRQPWIVDFGYAEVGASDRALAQDVAELLASLALVVGARAVDPAVAALGKPAIVAALPLIQPLALTTRTRHALHGHHGLLDDVRNHAADAVGSPHVKVEPLTRVRLRSVLTLACLLAATYILLPQFGEFHRTLAAAQHAAPGWLVLALITSACTSWVRRCRCRARCSYPARTAARS